MRTQAEIDAILRDVQDRLDTKRKTSGVALHVPAGGYTQMDDWLSVFIEPLGDGMHAYQYVQALGELESELRKTGVEKVVLVPAVPGW